MVNREQSPSNVRVSCGGELSAPDPDGIGKNARPRSEASLWSLTVHFRFAGVLTASRSI